MEIHRIQCEDESPATKYSSTRPNRRQCQSCGAGADRRKNKAFYGCSGGFVVRAILEDTQNLLVVVQERKSRKTCVVLHANIDDVLGQLLARGDIKDVESPRAPFIALSLGEQEALTIPSEGQ